MTVPSLRYGETRSRKEICTYGTQNAEDILSQVSDFGISDSFDAYALFEYLQQREIAKGATNPAVLAEFNLYSELHISRITSIELAREKLNLSLTTIFDVLKYGRDLADPYFGD